MTVVAVSCAPGPEGIEHNDPVYPGGPRREDVDLKLDGSQRVSQLNWNAEVTSAVVFRMTENLFSIREGISGEQRSTFAKSILDSIPQSNTKLANSPYADVLIEQSEKMAAKTLKEIIPELKASPGKVRKILAGMKPPVSRGDQVTLEQTVRRGFRFLRDFNERVAKADMLEQIKSGIRKEIDEVLEIEPRALAKIETLYSSQTIRAALMALKEGTSDLGIGIPDSAKPKIERGNKLGRTIDSIADAHSGLIALIDIWIFLSPKERVNEFKAASPELYEEFVRHDNEALRCMQDLECSTFLRSPKLWLIRTKGIEPEIEKYGFEKLRRLLNAKGVQVVRNEVLAVAIEKINGIAKLVGDQVEDRLKEKVEPVMRLQAEFKKEVRSRLDAWAAKNYEVNGPSVIVPKPVSGKIRFTPQGKIELEWNEMESNTLENVGAFDALAPVLWREAGRKPEVARSVVLLQISKLAKNFRNNGEGSLPSNAHSVSARAYAEVIRGLAALANSFKDWETSPVDALIGGVRARDLFPEFKIAELEQPLFPKDAFYAMSFHGLGLNLESLKGDRTQVFKIDANNRVTRANEPSSGADVMAGIADRNGTELAETVRSEDVARYLLSMCDVYRATKEIERSTSQFLLKPDQNGEIPRDKIVKSREEIRLLILGLANYLSHQLRAGGEFVWRELVINTHQPYDRTIAVMDQALAIRALVAASDTLGNEVYRWEAADLVSSLNRHFYRKELGFYARPEDRMVSPVVLLETMRALDAISPYLATFSRRQIENMTAPWREQVSKLQLVIK